MGRPPFPLDGRRPQYVLRQSGNRYRQLPALGYERDRDRAPLPLATLYDSNDRSVSEGVQVEPRELSAAVSSKSAPPAADQLMLARQPQMLSQVQMQQPPLVASQPVSNFLPPPPPSKNQLGYAMQPIRGMLLTCYLSCDYFTLLLQFRNSNEEKHNTYLVFANRTRAAAAAVPATACSRSSIIRSTVRTVRAWPIRPNAGAAQPVRTLQRTVARHTAASVRGQGGRRLSWGKQTARRRAGCWQSLWRAARCGSGYDWRCAAQQLARLERLRAA